MKEKKILLIEDEESLSEAITFALSLEDYDVTPFYSGQKALQEIDPNNYDVVILDIMLPGMSGFEICEKIRSNSQVPILFLSAKSASTDRIKGLKMGGDDYLVKPFDMEELLLRIQKQIPAEDENKFQNKLQLSTAVINFKSYEISGLKGKVQMPQKEMEILKMLVDKKGEVVSKNTIQDQVWHQKNYPGGRTLDNYISNLRKHIERDPKNPQYIFTVRGAGYKIELD